MLTMREFENYIVEHLKERLPECEITSRHVLKNNGKELTGVCIKANDSNIGPNIYIDKVYNRYIDGEDLDIILDELQLVYETNSNPEFNLGNLTIFHDVKDKLDIKVINTALNEEYLQNVPSMKFMDLSIVARIKISDNATITITNAMLNEWKLDKAYVLGCAIANTLSSDKLYIKPIGQVIAEMTSLDVPEEVDDAFYVCRTEADNGQYGARAMLFNKQLMEFAKSIDSDLYVIPSSIHEILLIQIKSNASHNEINDMIKDVNSTAVENEDILSDHVYIFHKDTGFES